MKRFVAIALALFMMLVQVSSYAASDIPRVNGNLELRGGIHFGMTLSDVVAFEQGKGNSNYKTNTADDEIYEYDIDYTTTIAGVNSSYGHLRYYFGQQDSLIGMGYMFGEGDHPVNGNNIYDEMYSTMVQKYGEPMSKDALISSSPYTQELYDSLYMQSLMKMIGKSYTVKNVAQWLVAYDDCYLLIDMHISIYSSTSNPFLHIGYRLFSEAELQALIGNDVSTQEESNQQRNNDL